MKKFVNHQRVIGRLGQEPSFMPGKENCLKLSVYTKEDVKTEDDQFQVTTWHNVALFGPEADKLSKSLSKGDWVEVTGTFNKRRYQGKFYDQLQAQKIKAL